MTVSYYGPNTVSKELFTQQLVESPPSIISIDVETISLKQRLPIGFAIATAPDEAWYFKVYPELDPEVELLKPLLANPKIKKVYQNAMFDVRVLPIGLPDFEIDDTNVADTLVMARLLGKPLVKLSELSPEVGMYIQSANDLLVEYQAKTMLDIPVEATAAMCASHAKATLALFYKFLPDIDTDYFNIEMSVIPILVDMSQRGLKIDQRARAMVESRLEGDVAYYRQLCAEEDFNPGSPQQVSYILAKRGNFLPMNKTKTAYRTDEKVLQFCDDPLAAVVLNFRDKNTLLTRYIRPLAGLDRVYTEYSLDTVIGRTTSSKGGEKDKTNMQNWPPDVRYILCPDSGTFTHGDFSQEHLRILMYKSGDRVMQNIYSQPVYFPDGERNPEADIHAMTARALNIPRRLAKIVNFAIPYGGTAKVIHERAKIANLKICQNFLDKWYETYIDAAEWLRAAQDYGENHHKSLPTLFGREVAIPEEWTKWGKIDKEAMRRKAVNYPILGSDGEIMKRALIICSKKGLPLAVQVHDSIDCDGDIEFPVEQLEGIAPVHIPFSVEKNPRWK